MKNIITSFLILSIASVQAQTYPFIENFESGFSQFNAINTLNGYSSDMSVYPRGINNTNCAQAQLNQFNHKDSLVSPLVGPITANTEAFFYFRVVSYIASTATSYTLAANENIVVQAGNQSLNFYNTVYTITSANQNSGTAFLKVSVNVSAFAGQSGNIKFIVNAPGNTDWFFHLDSLVLREAGQVSTPPSVSGVKTNVSCFGGNNGSINITVTGGASPLTFAWSDNNQSEDRTGLSAGTYSVTVTDNNSQTASATFNISEPSQALNIQPLSTTNVTCAGNCDGAISSNVSGGTTNYTYSWSNNATSASLSSVCPGTYTLTVTDANSCTASASASVTEPSALSAAVNNDTVNAGTEVIASASGGTSPYSFSWGSGNNNDTLSNPTAGTYTVTVTDANACTATAVVVVLALPNGLVQDMLNSMILYPSVTSGIIFMKNVPDKTNISIMDMQGRQLIQIQNLSAAGQIDVSSLANATYLMEVRNGNSIRTFRFTKE